jgi:hypothetical protein
MLESLFDKGEDVPYPVVPDMQQIILCGSAPGFAVSGGDFPPQSYPSTEAVLNSLVAVEKLTRDGDPLENVHANLRSIS